MKRSWFYIVMTAFFFGTMEVASKIGGAQFNSIQLVFLRFIIGGLFLLPFALADVRKKQIHFSGSDVLYMLMLGIICVCISMALFQVGVVRIHANLAAIIMGLNPLFTMIFARFLLGEKLTGKKIVVLVISLAGLVFVMNPASVVSGELDLFGFVISLIASVCFGLYTAVGKLRLAKFGGMIQNSFSFLLGSAVLLIIMLIFRIPVVQGITSTSIPVLLYLGVCVTGLGYYFLLKAVDQVGPSNASYAFFIKPVIASLASWLILGEELTANLIIGIAIILTGSVINMLPEKNPKSVIRPELKTQSGRQRADV